MKEQKINHLAVWICVIAFQLISVLWYSQVLFADQWIHYLGKTFDDFKGESPVGLIYAIAGAIFFSYFLSWLFIRLNINSGFKGLQIALLIGLCCFCFQTFMQDSFSLRPIGLSLINCGDVLLNFCFAGFLLGSWKKYKS